MEDSVLLDAPQGPRRRPSSRSGAVDYVQRRALAVVSRTKDFLRGDDLVEGGSPQIGSGSRSLQGSEVISPLPYGSPSPKGSPSGKRPSAGEFEVVEGDSFIPVLTVPCGIASQVQGHLQVYNNRLVFTHYDLLKEEKVSLTLSLSSLDTLKRNGRYLTLGVKKLRVNLSGVDDRKRVISMIKELRRSSPETAQTASVSRSSTSDELEDFDISEEGKLCLQSKEWSSQRSVSQYKL